MYTIVVYDVNAKRIDKVKKLCRMYLHHIQNSVFEGDITDKNFREFKDFFRSVIKEDEDSVLIFKMRSKDMFKKEVIGVEKNPAENIL